MDENEVIRRVVEELKAKGYTIVRTANTHDRGDDIVAHQNGKHLEAIPIGYAHGIL